MIFSPSAAINTNIKILQQKSLIEQITKSYCRRVCVLIWEYINLFS